MKRQILNLSMILLTTILVVSCGGKKDDKPSSIKNATSSVKSDSNEALKSDTLTEVKKKKVVMRTCDCCGRDYPKKKGWYWSDGMKQALKSKAGKFCSKKCAKDPDCG
jgi:hypothetical protein